MHFIYPAFLIGLLAVGIPILIHLFNFRRFKKVLFTNVRFLNEVKMQSQKQRNLKHLLVLCSRILAITALVFAFAQPYLAKEALKTESGVKAISIYIDNSFSMGAVSEKGPLLEAAKAKAREISSAYGPGDKFQILSNNFNGTHDRFYNREEFLQKLDEIDSDPSTKTLEEIVQKQNNFLNNSGVGFKRAYVISDFQKSFAGSRPAAVDNGIELNLVPLTGNSSHNLLIDTAWFGSPVFQPNQALSLMVRIKNLGEESLEGGTVALKLNGMQKSITGFDIAAGETKEVSLGFSVNTTGWQNAELALTDHPIVFDDVYHFTFNISPEIKVLGLYDSKPNVYLQKLYATEPYFRYESIPLQQVNYSKLGSYDLIALSEVKELSNGMTTELLNFLANGGNIAIFPSPEGVNSSLNQGLKDLGCSPYGAIVNSPTEVASLDYQNELFQNIIENRSKNLELPKVLKYFSISSNSLLPAYNLMRLRNEGIFLKAYEQGKGHIYQFSVPLQSEWSNFQQNQLFVPIIFRMSFMKKSGIPLAYVIGKNNLLNPVKEIKGSKKPAYLKKGSFEVMVERILKNKEIFLSENNQVKEAGLYKLFDPESNEVIQTMAFNYDRTESEVNLLKPSELMAIYAGKGVKVFEKTEIPLNSLIKQEENGKPLWRLFIGLALLFIAIEILLLRFWKNITPNPSQALS